MKISSASDLITIHDNIKSISDYQDIKSTFDKVIKEYKTINVHIIDSVSITSSVIGYLNKLVLKDKIVIQMSLGNDQLFELFEDLNLSPLFNVQKL